MYIRIYPFICIDMHTYVYITCYPVSAYEDI